jgi:hypothetical protein
MNVRTALRPRHEQSGSSIGRVSTAEADGALFLPPG